MVYAVFDLHVFYMHIERIACDMQAYLYLWLGRTLSSNLITSLPSGVFANLRFLTSL